jgi:hypothetical protein
MKHLRHLAILLTVFAATNCEMKDDASNGTGIASVVAFHPEKLYCYWGWEIRVGTEIIRADSIPGLTPSSDTTYPVYGNITIGEKTRTCSAGIDYYTITAFDIVK